MADVRSLLKAKRQEARISHPYATYTPSDQLKCSICALVLKHPSAWEGHLGSKAHRTAVGRVRQAELEAAAAAASLKDADDDDDSDGVAYGVDDDGRHASTSSSKRKASVSSLDLETKKRRKVPAESGFPVDFFSDSTRQVFLGDNGAEDAMAVDSTQKSAVDQEYERFQRELMRMQADGPLAGGQKQEAYMRATVAAEEELYTEQQKSGFEGLEEGREQAAPTEPADETEEQKRQRDRELIMDRLLEEERLQEDADMRVTSMKARMEALKKKREQRKAGRS